MAAIEVSYREGMQFEALTPSGHRVRMDGAAEVGGQNQGPRPMELLLVALGGCSGIDVVSILKKMRVRVQALDMQVDGVRASQDPKIYETIAVHYQVQSPDASAEQVLRAVRLSEEKYCSVAAMLGQAARIRVSVDLNGKSLPY